MEPLEKVETNGNENDQDGKPENVLLIGKSLRFQLEFKITVLATDRMPDLYVNVFRDGLAIWAFLAEVHDELESGMMIS